MSGPCFAAVVLAAGRARRMRGVDKLLLDVGGRALVRRTFDVLRAGGVGPVVVVTGPEPQRIAAVFAGTDARLVHNPGFEAGRRASARAGLAAARGLADAVLVAPGDLPLLEPDDVRGLLDAWRARPADRAILVPWHRGVRGNPVIFDASQLDSVVADEQGPRGFIDRHPQLVERVEFPNDHPCVDVDTPEDAARLGLGAAHPARRAAGQDDAG